MGWYSGLGWYAVLGGYSGLGGFIWGLVVGGNVPNPRSGGWGGNYIAQDKQLKGTLKTVLLGIVVIGLLAILTTELLTAFGVNNTFILVLFGTIVPIIIGVLVLLRLLDVI